MLDEEPSVLYRSRLTLCQNIIRVCSQWHDIGVEFMYEVLELVGWTPVRGVSAVLSIFEASAKSDPEGRGYGRWTKRIDIADIIFLSNDDAQLFLKLLSLCHNLTILVCRAGRDPAFLQSETHHRLLQILENRSLKSFRRLDWPLSMRFGHPAHSPVVPTLPLTSLDIQIGILPPLIVRESVTTLSLRPSYGKAPDPLSSPDWHFTRLKHLGLADLADRDVEPLVPFLIQHSDLLRSLAIRSRYDNENIIFNLSSLTQAVAQLRTLLIRDVDLPFLSGSYPTLTHIGVIDIPRHFNGVITPGPIRAMRSDIFPSIQCVRLLELQEPIDSHSTYGAALVLCVGRGIKVEQVVGEE
jgi:hypothetical protein